MKAEEKRARKIINSMAVTHSHIACDWDESDLAFVMAEILAAQREAEKLHRQRIEDEIKDMIRGVATTETNVRDALYGVLGRVHSLSTVNKHERVAREIVKQTIGGADDEPEIETVARILRREYGEASGDG